MLFALGLMGGVWAAIMATMFLMVNVPLVGFTALAIEGALCALPTLRPSAFGLDR